MDDETLDRDRELEDIRGSCPLWHFLPAQPQALREGDEEARAACPLREEHDAMREDYSRLLAAGEDEDGPADEPA